MKIFTCFICLFFTFYSLISAQKVNSFVINRIDSLIKISRDLTSKKEFEKALEVNSIAEKLALEKSGKVSED